jgi:hypothetical protein
MADSTFAALSVVRPRPARPLHLRTNHALSFQCRVVYVVREWDGSRAGLGAWWRRGLVGWLGVCPSLVFFLFPRLWSNKKKRRWSCGSQPGRPATGAGRGCQGSLQGRGCGCVSGGPRHAGSHGEAWRVREGRCKLDKGALLFPPVFLPKLPPSRTRPSPRRHLPHTWPARTTQSTHMHVHGVPVRAHHRGGTLPTWAGLALASVATLFLSTVQCPPLLATLALPNHAWPLAHVPSAAFAFVFWGYGETHVPPSACCSPCDSVTQAMDTSVCSDRRGGVKLNSSRQRLNPLFFFSYPRMGADVVYACVQVIMPPTRTLKPCHPG